MIESIIAVRIAVAMHGIAAHQELECANASRDVQREEL
jgi:hypothetical protein